MVHGRVGPQLRVEMPWQHVGRGIPYGAAGLTTTCTVTDADVGRLSVLEHVQAVLTLTHAQRGDLVIDLEAPSGCTSRLATRRSADRATTGLNGWAFDTVRCWGESAAGVWTLTVRDEFNEAKAGTLTAWRLVLYGTEAVPGADGAAGSPERGSPAPPTAASPTTARGDPAAASTWQRQVLVPVLLVVAAATVVVAVLVAVVGRVAQWRRRGTMGRDRVVFVPLSTVSTGTDAAAVADQDT
jgi:subtilisin-like proprotein convertase family protein